MAILKPNRTKYEVYATYDDRLTAEQARDEIKQQGFKAKVKQNGFGWVLYMETRNIRRM